MTEALELGTSTIEIFGWRTPTITSLIFIDDLLMNFGRIMNKVTDFFAGTTAMYMILP